MTSKRTPADKRATLPRSSDYTKPFLKDWERLSRSGRHDMKKLKEAMVLLIANDGPPGAEWRDHALIGDWQGYRECHISGDFLLIYAFNENGNPHASSLCVPVHMLTFSNKSLLRSLDYARLPPCFEVTRVMSA